MGGRGASGGSRSGNSTGSVFIGYENEEKPKKKKKLSDYYKEAKERELDRFYGEDRKRISNQYFKFEHVKSNDEIIVVTNNVKILHQHTRGRDPVPVLIVGNNKAVYLKDWQFKPVKNFDMGMQGYAVKLNRKYFKPYTFKSAFEGFAFKKDDTFDSLLKVAKKQNDTKVAPGHFKGSDPW